MSHPLVNALVTATPSAAGYPTLTGYTDTAGQVSLPLNFSVTYTLVFSGGVVGSVAGFSPAPTTLVFHPLKNVGAHPVTVSTTGVSPASSLPAYPGSFPVRPSGSAPGFRSWQPASLFADPVARSTRLRMPAARASISLVSGPVYKLENIGVYPFRVVGKSVFHDSSVLVSPGDHPISAKPPSSVNFSSWNPGALVTDPTASHTSLVMPASSRQLSFKNSVPTRKLYVFDGIYDHATTGYMSVYSALTNSWSSSVASDPAPRSNLTAFVLDVESKFYAVDGTNGRNLATNNAYDPTTDTWSARADDLVARRQLGGGGGGVGYAFEGNSSAGVIDRATYYNRSVNNWTEVGPAPLKRAAFATGAAQFRSGSGGHYYLDGGRSGAGDSFPPIKKMSSYNAASALWDARAPDPTSRSQMAGATISVRFFVVGGRLPSADLTAANNEWDSLLNSWTGRASVPVSREELMVAALGSRVYALGGLNAALTPLADMHAFDPLANTWSARTAMPVARYAGAVAVV